MKNKYTAKMCNNKMSFEECEYTILRHAIDETENIKGKKQVNNEDVQKMLTIVEEFIVNKKLICYGGTAINNILPKYAQFYRKDIEIPDYDFFSSNALEDAKELANIYYEKGYRDVEAKAGVHMGTFKVFVNYIPIADITLLHKELYENLLNDSIKIAGIHYCPPNFLRMGMYLELSRPEGDVSRWEKVYKRLNLLNQHYPISNKVCKSTTKNIIDEKLYNLVCNTLVNNDAIFFGGYAYNLYQQFYGNKSNNHTCFDVLAEDTDKLALIIEEQLQQSEYKSIKKIVHEPVGEIIPEHIEIRVGTSSVAYIYKPIACHNYNIITNKKQEIKIATIDTILSFYLAFIYANKQHFEKNRLLCMSKFLFDLSEKNKTETNGVLKRFSVDCYGTQSTLESMRAKKSAQFKKLKNDRTSKEYEMWFLNYTPYKLDNKTIVNKHSIHIKDIENSLKSLKKSSKKSSKSSTMKSKTTKTKKTRKNTPDFFKKLLMK